MKKIVFLLYLLIAGISLQAQNISQLFIDIPNHYIPQLENEWRKDLVDLYTSGKEAHLQNLLGGNSELKKLTDNYLLLQTTERSTLEMKLLPLVNNTHIICVISTVEGPVADSQVRFYTTEWEPLPSVDLFTPVSRDWFIKEDIDKNSDEYLYATSRLDMDLFHYTLDSEAQTLTVTYTTPLYLSAPDRAEIMPVLKDSPYIYTWERFRFQ